MRVLIFLDVFNIFLLLVQLLVLVLLPFIIVKVLLPQYKWVQKLKLVMQSDIEH